MKQKNAGQERVYKNNQEIDHDLYRLNIAPMKKNVSYNPKRPIWEDTPHVHIFHTVDSNGKTQDKCHKVGGHFHFVQYEPSETGVPTLKISPAMHYVRVKNEYGEDAIEAQEIPYDKHTHEWEYISSEKIKIREINKEFVKTQAAIEAKKPSKVDGIVG